MKRTTPSFRLALIVAALLSACATTQDAAAPSAPISAAYKEVPPGWIEAAPADALERGPWWTLFGDPLLDDLAKRVEVSNQNIAAATAAYAQARAIVREQRASLFPIVSLDGGVARGGGSGASGSSRGTQYQIGIGASWEPDVFGRLRSGVNAAGASAQASAADLASAKLAAQGELATNYFLLRETDAEAALLVSTIEAYQRSAQITQNRYDAGIAPKSDVLQAQTQLANAQADLAGLERQRAQLEHAIAVLVGTAPGDFTLPATPWKSDALPAVPIGVPSALLQRRPDIASAERRVAAANAQIGIARAACFPSFSLTGSYGLGAARLADLFSLSSVAWSLGASIVQTVFDAGATRARVDQVRAGWEQTVAQYRQTVLVALQDVEDQLAAARVLERQHELRRQASEAADQTEQQVMNRYRAAQVSYSEVVIAQVSALNARRALVQVAVNRQTAAVALIQALGGGWQATPT